jgi:hypothetical protein
MSVLNKYTGAFDYTSPDLAALGFDWPELAKADAEIRRLGALHTKTDGEILRLRQTREDAVGKDSSAYAAALRNHKPDPGRKHAEALERSLAGEERKLAALEVALNELDTERRTLMDAKRPKWRAEVQAKTPEAAEALRAAVAAVQLARGRLHSLQGLARWLEEPSKAYESKAPARDTFHVIGMQTRQEPPVDIGGALGAILREADGGADGGAEGSAA